MTNAQVSISSTLLWDIAGVDGLQVIKTLFGEKSDRPIGGIASHRIAPFQSIEAELDRTPCSLLRLCEANFRLRWTGDAEHLKSLLTAATANRQVWVRQFPWLVSVQLPLEIDMERLSTMAIAKPPFSITALALNCAAPARIETLSVLVWRRAIQSTEQTEHTEYTKQTEVIELHTALQTVQQLKSSLVNH